ASGLAQGKFDVGAYEMEALDLIEVDAEARGRRVERFAPDHLGDAVARLYERYAELLPDGPARTLAAATARPVAPVLGPGSLDACGAALGPDVEVVGDRTRGLPSSRGRDAYLRSLGALLELADDVANRIDDVLAVRSDARLARVTNFGTDRVGGGAYERQFLSLVVFGTDGLITHHEVFDPDRAAEALARLDE